MISEAREATSADIEAQEAASPARIMMRGTRGRVSTEAQESSSYSFPGTRGRIRTEAQESPS